MNLQLEAMRRERDEARAELADLERQVDAGTRELRRYVEGNGFTWCEDEDTVFNVTTAIGWMGGAIDELHRKLAEARQRGATAP